MHENSTNCYVPISTHFCLLIRAVAESFRVGKYKIEFKFVHTFNRITFFFQQQILNSHFMQTYFHISCTNKSYLFLGNVYNSKTKINFKSQLL